MDFFKLPTDNMYKFLALSGLAVFIVIIVYIGPKRLEIEIDRERLQGKMKEIEYEMKHFSSLSPDEKLAQEDKMYELGLRVIRLETTAKEISARDSQIQFYRKIWWMIFLGASSLFLFGFVFWYTQVQRYQDEILRKQAAELSTPPS